MTLVQIKQTSSDGGVFETTGVIAEVEGDVFLVTGSLGSYRARQAASCLLRPEVDDHVLVAGPKSGALFVLAVLERASDGPKTLATDGDLEFDVAGSFKVRVSESIELLSQERVRVASRELETTAGNAKFHFRQVALLANLVDASAERISTRVRRVFRRVLEMEHVRSAQLDYKASGTVRLHGQSTVLSATELIKADASQIHIG